MNFADTKFERYWHPMGKNICIRSDGLLVDKTLYGNYDPNKNAKPLSKLRQVNCLVLIGEIGTGKSWSVDKEISELDEEGICAQKLDLGALESGEIEQEISKILDSSILKISSQNTYLFIDSFNKCKLTPVDIVKSIKKHLKDNDLAKLFIRFIFRPSLWNESTKKEITTLGFSDKNFKVYRISPLSKSNLKEIFKVESEEVRKAFDEWVEENALEPFLSVPLTLSYLLLLKEKESKLSQREIFENCCKLLAGQKISKNTVLKNQESWNIISRFAAISIFQGKPIERYEYIFNQGFIYQIKIDKVIKYEKSRKGKINPPVTIAEIELNKILDYGFFRVLNNNSVEWVHRYICEFLAAWYFHNHIKNIDELEKLFFLTSKEIGETRVYPQLREVAAWCAQDDRQMFEKIIKNDPLIFLTTSSIIYCEESRKKMLNVLMESVSTERLPFVSYNIEKKLNKLNFSDIEEKLHYYLFNLKDMTKEKQSAVIKIAMKCKLKDEILQKKILEIAVDDEEEATARKDAARFLFYTATPKVKKLLSQHFMKRIRFHKDKDDDIRGYLLSTVWPEYIELTNLIEYIEKPKRENYFGSYRLFYQEIFPEKLRKKCLTVEEIDKTLEKIMLIYKRANPDPGVKSLSNKEPFRKSWIASSEVADYLILLAWEYFEHISQKEAFANILVEIWDSHREMFPYAQEIRNEFKNKMSTPSKNRETLVKELVKITYNHMRGISFVRSKYISLSNKDLDWLIQCFYTENEIKIKEYWITLINIFFDPKISTQVDKIYKIYKEYKDLEVDGNNKVVSTLRHHFEGIQLDSEKAEWQREYYDKEDLCSQGRKQSEPYYSEADFLTDVENYLHHVKNGKVEHWVNILNSLTTADEGAKSYYPAFSNPCSLKYWQKIDTQLQNRIIEAAKEYVVNKELCEFKIFEDWFESNKYSNFAIAGLRAFQLLISLKPQYTNSFDSKVWENWCSTILICLDFITDQHVSENIVEYVYEYAPNHFIKYLQKIIVKENRDFDHLFFLTKLAKLKDDNICSILYENLHNDNLKPTIVGDILSELLMSNHKEAYEFAILKITDKLPEDTYAQEKILNIACALIKYSKNIQWDKIWRLIKSNKQFGEKFIKKLAYDTNYEENTNSILDKLNIREKINLYEYILELFPPEDDPDRTIPHTVTPIHNAVDLRDNIHRNIINSGSIEAIKYFKSKPKPFPDDINYNVNLKMVKERYLENSWNPKGVVI
jgi:hypothetical protein